MKKEPLLFLCHRIPYPPNKGDKIRSFNILKKLNEHFDVHLACFIDDPFDKQYVDGLREYCASLFYLEQHKMIAKIKGLTSLITSKPITLPYYFARDMQQWVNRTIVEQGITKAFVYSSSMAQYIEDKYLPEGHEITRVIDFVDVDSDKWRQYAEKKSGLARWIFQREYQLLAAYEDKICQQFDHSLFVSPDEASLFKARQSAENAQKVHGVLNGVDINFFDPSADMTQESLVPAEPYIVFTGAMDYWANIDSVIWFVENVWPNIIQHNPQAKFAIVGGNPSAQVKALSKQKGVVVTGRVHDIRPYILQAKCVVAPLQIARGIQNKVLEAMSLNKSVVVTPMAMEGVNAKPSADIVITEDAVDYANACLRFLNEEKSNDVQNRQWIKEHFTWQQTLVPMLQYFSQHESDYESTK